MIEVVMPEMGESVAEGTITRWLVKVGDAVERDQPIVEISTDKVDAEIPSPAAGTLQEIRAEEGAVVQVDAVLAVIATDGESASPSVPTASAGVPSAPARPNPCHPARLEIATNQPRRRRHRRKLPTRCPTATARDCWPRRSRARSRAPKE